MTSFLFFTFEFCGPDTPQRIVISVKFKLWKKGLEKCDNLFLLYNINNKPMKFQKYTYQIYLPNLNLLSKINLRWADVHEMS